MSAAPITPSRSRRAAGHRCVPEDPQRPASADRNRHYSRMDEQAKVDVEGLGRGANVVLARDLARRFPGLLIQGDSLSILLSDLDEEARIATHDRSWPDGSLPTRHSWPLPVMTPCPTSAGAAVCRCRSRTVSWRPQATSFIRCGGSFSAYASEGVVERHSRKVRHALGGALELAGKMRCNWCWHAALESEWRSPLLRTRDARAPQCRHVNSATSWASGRCTMPRTTAAERGGPEADKTGTAARCAADHLDWGLIQPTRTCDEPTVVLGDSRPVVKRAAAATAEPPTIRSVLPSPRRRRGRLQRPRSVRLMRRILPSLLA